MRIAGSALASDVPHSDLFVTYSHALFIDGSLVQAGSLINGKTITFYQPDEADELEYFHIKLKSHNVIYAQGARCETLLSIGKDAADFDEQSCVAILAYKGARSKIKSRIRSAVSPWLDRRKKIDIIRDRLEERAAVC